MAHPCCWGTPACGAGSRGHLRSKPVTVKGHQGVCPHAQRGHLTMDTTARAISTTALGGERLRPSLPTLLPSGASPPGQRAEGGWGDWAGQPAQPEQREGRRCESTAGAKWACGGSLQGFSSTCKVSQGAGENGDMRTGLGSLPAEASGGKVWVTAVFLASCSPATDHQVVVETKAGGSPLAAAGALRV